MNASAVSAIVVTRGDVPLDEILDSLDQAGFDDVIVYDNSKLPDLAVYGRYAAIEHAEHPTILVQDDDCVLAPEAFEQLLAAYEPGSVVCNMPQRFRHDFYCDHALVGFGAIFDRDLPTRAFQQYASADDLRKGIARMQSTHRNVFQPWALELAGLGEHFHRTCDVVFTALTPRILVDAPYADLAWATDETRMYRQPEHVGERARMLNLVRQVRDGAAA